MNMTTQTPENTSEVTFELTSLDRCDSCGAQAYVRVRLQSGELYFCGHHAAEAKPRLETVALEWHDETARLDEAPAE
jgi:anti-anti-sigma regulatory factor